MHSLRITVVELGYRDVYVTGSNEDVVIMVVADIFGWKFTNLRLLADYHAKAVNATVYLPDLYVTTHHSKN